MGRAVIIVALAAMLVGAAIWAGWVWMSIGDADIGMHGTIALTLGIVVSVVVGVGLMILVFYSARRGYDEQVQYDFGEGRDHSLDDDKT